MGLRINGGLLRPARTDPLRHDRTGTVVYSYNSMCMCGRIVYTDEAAFWPGLKYRVGLETRGSFVRIDVLTNRQKWPNTCYEKG